MGINEVTLLVIIQITLAHCLHLYHRVLWKFSFVVSVGPSLCSPTSLSLTHPTAALLLMTKDYSLLHSSLMLTSWTLWCLQCCSRSCYGGIEPALCPKPMLFNDRIIALFPLDCLSGMGSPVTLLWNSSSVGHDCLTWDTDRGVMQTGSGRHTQISNF